MPKELVCVEVGKLAWRTYEEPKLAVGQVRIRSEFGAAKHGTEMSIFKGYALSRGWMDGRTHVFNKDLSITSFPFVVGNMVAGTITEVGADVAGTGEKGGQKRLICPGHSAKKIRLGKASSRSTVQASDSVQFSSTTRREE